MNDKSQVGILAQKRLDVLMFILLTFLALLNGSTTVFYLIYFFWWTELIRFVVDWIYIKKNPNAKVLSETKHVGFEMFFLMGIYFVFIVVFFGILSCIDDTPSLLVNMEILFFRNWFFNLNLVLFAAHRIWSHYSQKSISMYFGGFTPNMIVLHISIILGGILMFFVVKNYPDFFNPYNTLGAGIIALPFVLLRMFVGKE